MKRGIFFGLGITTFLTGCSEKSSQQGFVPPPVPVQTAVIEMRDVPLFFEAIGYIKPSQTVEIRPQITRNDYRSPFY